MLYITSSLLYLVLKCDDSHTSGKDRTKQSGMSFGPDVHEREDTPGRAYHVSDSFFRSPFSSGKATNENANAVPRIDFLWKLNDW